MSTTVLRKCSTGNCTQDWFAREWCKQHYMQRYHKGEFGPRQRGRTASAYGSVHRALRRIRGSASNWDCVQCGQMALEWAYDQSGVEERFSPEREMFYSTDLSCYMPMCKSCHIAFDKSSTAAKAALADARRRTTTEEETA